MTGNVFEMEREAIFSDCKTWRYSLTRTWDSELPKACFIMLNPSVADANRDDPTTTQCLKRVIKAGYGSYEAVNLFALVATDPKLLNDHDDPIGPDNSYYICEALSSSQFVVVAWGTGGVLWGRGDNLLTTILKDAELYCLGTNLDGSPKFPLRVPYRQGFVRFAP